MTQVNALAATGSLARIFSMRGPKPLLDAEGRGGASGETELKMLAANLKLATDETKRWAETATTEMKNLGALTAETKAKSDEAMAKMNALDARMTEAEQKIVRRPASGADEHKSVGQQFVDSEEFKTAAAQGDRFRGRVNIEVKTITSASTSGASPTTGLVVADRVPGIIQLPNRQLRVRDVLQPGRTNSGNIEYVKETTFTNNASTVAENPASPKPESNIVYALTPAPVRTLAHFIKASKQILADAPQLQSQIDGRLRYGLAFVEDNQLLNGDGTGTNLSGLNTNATAYAAPTGAVVTNETMIDRLRLAFLQATLAMYPADGAILHPTDWANIELKKDTQNRYLWANPSGILGPTIWGRPVVETLAEPQNNFLVGAFKMAAQIFDREDANVLISTEDQDNFAKNMVTILAEERLALAVFLPAALIKGNFTGAA